MWLFNLLFSSLSQLWYVEVRISRSISVSPLEFEITRVDCTWVIHTYIHLRWTMSYLSTYEYKTISNFQNFALGIYFHVGCILIRLFVFTRTGAGTWLKGRILWVFFFFFFFFFFPVCGLQMRMRSPLVWLQACVICLNLTTCLRTATLIHKLAWDFTGCLCDKYPFPMWWLILTIILSKKHIKHWYKTIIKS